MKAERGLSYWLQRLGVWSGETAEFLRCLPKSKAGTHSDAEQGQDCLVEEVEQHPGVQRSKGLRIVSS